MSEQSLYSKRPNLVIGFHGCDESIAKQVVCRKAVLKTSHNDYDWLGHGVYFWENNQARALEWAKSSKSINVPAVLGAIIDLGYCMDLMDSEYLHDLKIGYDTLLESTKFFGVGMPENKGTTEDKLRRNLDCAVIEVVHTLNENDDNKASFDSVRGVFWEGEELYPNAFFKEKNHIQICVRNPNCIKGFFLPRSVDKNYLIP